ncbi:MAG: hypothetical protein M5U28_14145 [Sandaracinaceae bacterium]|nr:hypothetical protein [Sandaracinaceae bacterium]
MIRGLRDWLLERRALLLSGSFVDVAVTTALLGLAPEAVDIRNASVPLHRGVEILVHSTGGLPTDQPESPRRLGASDLAAIITTAGALHRVHFRRPLRVLLYGDSKRAAQGLAAELGKNTGLRVELVVHQRQRMLGGSAIEVKARDMLAEVVVEHLRSPTSRGLDREFDVVVVFGSGRPAFGERQAVALILQMSMGLSLSGTELAHESRLRAITQAALRRAGLAGRSVVLMVSDLLPSDLPPYIAGRARSASTLFAAEPGDPVPVVERQRVALAMSIVELLRSGEVAVPMWWLPVAALTPPPATPQRLRANLVEVRRVAQALVRGGLLSSSASEAKNRVGRELLALLLKWGALGTASGWLPCPAVPPGLRPHRRLRHPIHSIYTSKRHVRR